MKIDKEYLKSSLVDFGLSEKEASLYISSLEIGSSNIVRLAKLSDIKRPTAYLVIESLIKKGLMKVEITGLKKKYAPEKPERLENIIDQKKNDLIKNLPFLNQIYSEDKNDTFIKYYEGLNAIKLIYNDLLKDLEYNSDYCVIGNQDIWFYLDQKFFQNFIENRSKKTINIRLLFQDSEIAREHKKFEKNYNEKIKILPLKTSITTNMVITSKKLLIHQLFPTQLCIVIENKSIIKMNQEMFEIIWNSIDD